MNLIRYDHLATLSTHWVSDDSNYISKRITHVHSVVSNGTSPTISKHMSHHPNSASLPVLTNVLESPNSFFPTTQQSTEISQETAKARIPGICYGCLFHPNVILACGLKQFAELLSQHTSKSA